MSHRGKTRKRDPPETKKDFRFFSHINSLENSRSDGFNPRNAGVTHDSAFYVRDYLPHQKDSKFIGKEIVSDAGKESVRYWYVDERKKPNGTEKERSAPLPFVGSSDRRVEVDKQDLERLHTLYLRVNEAKRHKDMQLRYLEGEFELGLVELARVNQLLGPTEAKKVFAQYLIYLEKEKK